MRQRFITSLDEEEMKNIEKNPMYRATIRNAVKKKFASNFSDLQDEYENKIKQIEESLQLLK